MSERSPEETAAVIAEAEAMELVAHARLMGDTTLLREAEARLATARKQIGIERHLRLGDQIAEELRRLGVTEASSSERTVGIREHWPKLLGIRLRPFARMGPALARDVPDVSARVDDVSVGPVTIERANSSRTEMVVRASVPREWSGGFLALELDDEANIATYLTPIFEHSSQGMAVLRVRTRARNVDMTVGSRPLAVSELTDDHVAAATRSLYQLVPEAAVAWREAARDPSVSASVRDAISEALGGN